MPKVKSGINGKTTSLRSLNPGALLGKKESNKIEAYGSAGPLRVIRINLTEKDFINSELKKAGLPPLRSEDLRKRISAKSALLLNELSKEAWNAVKSKIPYGHFDRSTNRDYDSGKLREQVRLTGGGAGTAKQFSVGTGTINLSREAVVATGKHSPIPYHGFTGRSSSLAAYLDTSGLHRTKPSVAQGSFTGEPAGADTKWSAKAIAEFKAEKGSIIKRILSKI